MNIGSRWPVGGEAPASLPPVVREAIAAEERALIDLGADTTGWGWTLTYLEGAPIVECDDGTRITLTGDGVLVERD